VRAQDRPKNIGKTLTIVGFLLPSVLIYFGLVILPIFQASYYSLFKWNGLVPLDDFVGLDNYSQALQDGVFVHAVGNNILIAVLSACLQLPMALALALLIRRRMRGRTIFRMIFFLPYVLSEVVTGVLWKFIYEPQTGLLNHLLADIIPGFAPLGWLGDINTVMIWVFVVITWKYFGLYLVLFTAGLQNIPAELEEAARIDGASSGQVIRHVTVPLLAPTIRLALFLSIVGSLQIFDLVWIMTKGDPVNASQTMATYMYKYGFQRFALGYGSAVAVILFVLSFGFSILYQRYVMRRDYAS
jgi:raffinose/stachyose/melibiose transport system permease protein